MAIKLSPESRKQAIASLKRYFEEEMDDTIGDLKAGLLLDYFIVEIAPSVYNVAVADVQAFMQERVADVDGSCHEPEFGYFRDRR